MILSYLRYIYTFYWLRKKIYNSALALSSLNFVRLFFIKKNSWLNSFLKINKFGSVAGCVFSTQNSWHIIFNLNIRVLKLELGYRIILKIKSEKFSRNLIKL